MDYVSVAKVPMHIDHKIGEKIDIDWSGNTTNIININIGNIIKAYIFVAALHCSKYSY